VPTGKKLARLGQDCSDKERRAMQAERDLLELRSCQVMAGHLGETYSGTVSSVTEFGFFVELDDLYVDGLVHVRSLDDYFHFDPATMTLTGERRRRTYRAGMRVKVRVSQVELWRRRIDFALVEEIA
jgi:ribonuclease R